jgi:selenocysteine-specific elongation factor
VALVVGTAGHIDHGKTTLLRALTGIDADRLPEERRRGMTIDVGYAHLVHPGGAVIDFVDVPGHDRLVGNMLVGAGEIDAAMLVVAADDGPRAQTLEHLALLDALGIHRGLVALTKVDTVDEGRVAEVRAAVTASLASTTLGGVPIVAASGVSGEGIDALRDALWQLAASVPEAAPRPPSLAIDRAFRVKGRGVVVTGTLRGGPLSRGDRLRLVPDPAGAEREVRVREIQVHGTAVDTVAAGGRTALNLVGVELEDVPRGAVLTADPAVRATSRVLVAFRHPPADRAAGRLHAGTASVDARVGRSGRDALVLADGTAAGILRLAEPIALRPGDRAVLRRSPGQPPIGTTALDVEPARGLSRRRQDPARVDALAAAAPGARIDLHGIVAVDGRVSLAPDIRTDVEAVAAGAAGSGASDTVVRAALAARLRRLATVRRDEAAAAARLVLDELVANGRLLRDGDVVRAPGTAASAAAHDPRTIAAMDRLEAALAVPAPPPLAATARACGCPADAVRALERDGRIVVLEPDLAYAATTYRDLTATALRLASDAPLTPAAFRDATGTSRKYVMAILEDLDRRAILRRTPEGHVPGPRAGTT